MILFDTHIHLDNKAFSADLGEVLARAQAVGVTRFLSVGASDGTTSAVQAVSLADKHAFIWASVGIHPHCAGKELDFEVIRPLAEHPRVVAIGETGLDFHYDFAPRAAQEQRFIEQIVLARAVKKPLIIHSREAGERCLALLREHHAEDVGGVFHCYAEDAKFAALLRKINFMVSIGGIVTFKKAVSTQAAFAEIPLSQIMLETDAPFLAPEPHRGRRCESSQMVETAKKIAALKGISVEEVAAATTENALRFFKI